jgi:hypothetical protein
VPTQDPRCYIDLGQSFADYQEKFSSKTRATIKRKIKRFGAYCEGSIRWRAYRTADDSIEFYRLASLVSAETYQKKRLGAGLPRSKEFFRDMQALANIGQFRGFILFDHERPVAYLYCPAVGGVLEYQYLGYDPEYMQWSVGTILLWHALENIFDEACFKMFDFAGGQSDQIHLFATDRIQCANVYLLRRNLGNTVIVQAHRFVSNVSLVSGRFLETLGLKVKTRKLLRFWNLGISTRKATPGVNCSSSRTQPVCKRFVPKVSSVLPEAASKAIETKEPRSG